MRRIAWGVAAGASLWLAAAVPAGAAPVAPGNVGGAGSAQPAAMCGYSCRNGGRYIPGPPGVCREEGLRYCGSSRDVGPPREFRERRRDWDGDYDRGPRRGFYYGR